MAGYKDDIGIEYIKILEQKRIIEVKRIGKVNHIKLSEWFLGENEESPK